jgi:hypothetical protein
MSGADPGPDGPAETVTVSTEITDDRTVVRVSGDRDAAVVVRSASGEQIYLPPEDFDRPPETGRQTPYESPYEASRGGQSPYASSRDPQGSPGLEPTAEGFRIVHPEPVTEFRLLR